MRCGTDASAAGIRLKFDLAYMQLGQGSFGRVYKVRWYQARGSELMALKVEACLNCVNNGLDSEHTRTDHHLLDPFEHPHSNLSRC